MPAYSKEREYDFITRIRSVIVQKHDASGREIKEALNTGDDPVDLDLDYIYKLLRKIKQERAFRLDLQTLSEVLTEYQDKSAVAQNMLWTFITDPGIDISDRIAAIREMHSISTTVLDKLFDAGVFERNLGRMKAEGVLNPEQQEAIEKAMKYVFRYKQNPVDQVTTSPKAGSAEAAGRDNGTSGDQPANAENAGSE